MSDSVSAARRLRKRLGGSRIVVVPGVPSPLVAMLAEQIGFKAVYLSGAATSNNLGLPDVGLTTLTEVAQLANSITQQVSVPLIVDGDTGFGEVVNVARAVNALERANAAAIHFEDQVLPKKCGHLDGKELVSVEEMLEKIRAAVLARRSPSLVLIARTDARGVTGMDDALFRAKKYLEAGADMIFPEALESEAEFEEFAKKIKAPLLANMTEFGKSPYIPASRFEKMGYSIVIFPVTVLRMMLRAAEVALKEIQEEGSQVGLVDRMMTRAQVYKIINYEGYQSIDRKVKKNMSRSLKREAE